MIFQRKYERALKFQQEQKKKKREREGVSPDEDLRPEDIMEKGDIPALLIAAFVTFVPVVLVILLILTGIAYLLFT